MGRCAIPVSTMNLSGFSPLVVDIIGDSGLLIHVQVCTCYTSSSLRVYTAVKKKKKTVATVQKLSERAVIRDQEVEQLREVQDCFGRETPRTKGEKPSQRWSIYGGIRLIP